MNSPHREKRWPEEIAVALGPDGDLNTAHTERGIAALSRRQPIRRYVLVPSPFTDEGFAPDSTFDDLKDCR